MGEMLLATKRAKGTDKGGRQYVDGRHRRPSNAPPTLSELGLTKNESAKAQRIAEIPQDKFDEVTSGAKTVTQARREVAHEKAEALRTETVESVVDTGDHTHAPTWPQNR